MSFTCASKGFTAAARHPEFGYLGRGNVISNVQRSTFIRARTETTCNGYIFAPGRLRDYDLSVFGSDLPKQVRSRALALTETRPAILYWFFHWQGRVRVAHGWLLTDTDYLELWRCVTGATWKSGDVLAAAARDITETRAAA